MRDVCSHQPRMNAAHVQRGATVNRYPSLRHQIGTVKLARLARLRSLHQLLVLRRSRVPTYPNETLSKVLWPGSLPPLPPFAVTISKFKVRRHRVGDTVNRSSLTMEIHIASLFSATKYHNRQRTRTVSSLCNTRLGPIRHSIQSPGSCRREANFRFLTLLQIHNSKPTNRLRLTATRALGPARVRLQSPPYQTPKRNVHLISMHSTVVTIPPSLCMTVPYPRARPRPRPRARRPRRTGAVHLWAAGK